MERTVRIQAPLPHIKSVNIWLLRGDPLTLIDTGPRTDEALVALEAGLAREGLRLEDIELVIPTHHHLDHSGLIATIVGRSGARVAALDRAAEYGARYVERSAADRSFSLELMRHHGVPESVIEANEGFWDFIRDTSERVRDRRRAVRRRCDHRRRAGPADPGSARPQHDRCAARRRRERDRVRRRSPACRDLVERRDRPGGRTHRIATAGANRIPGQPPADRVDAARPVADRSRGSGRPITGGLVRRRISEHRRRCQRILTALEEGPANAYAIAGHLWSPRTVAEQPVLVVWEVLGHLDLLLDEGRVSEHKFDDGSRYGKAWFSLPEPNARGEDTGAPTLGAPRNIHPLLRS